MINVGSSHLLLEREWLQVVMWIFQPSCGWETRNTFISLCLDLFPRFRVFFSPGNDQQTLSHATCTRNKQEMYCAMQ